MKWIILFISFAMCASVPFTHVTRAFLLLVKKTLKVVLKLVNIVNYK